MARARGTGVTATSVVSKTLARGSIPRSPALLGAPRDTSDGAPPVSDGWMLAPAGRPIYLSRWVSSNPAPSSPATGSRRWPAAAAWASSTRRPSSRSTARRAEGHRRRAARGPDGPQPVRARVEGRGVDRSPERDPDLLRGRGARDRVHRDALRPGRRRPQPRAPRGAAARPSARRGSPRRSARRSTPRTPPASSTATSSPRTSC